MARKTEQDKAKALSGSVVATPSATAVLPLAVGAGIVGHSIYSTRSRILGDKFGGTSMSAAGEIAEVSNSVQSRAKGLAFRDLGQRIKDLSSGWRGGISPEAQLSQVQVALRHATRSMDSEVASGIVAKVESFARKPGVTSQGLLEFISTVGNFGGSVGTRRAGLRFIQNLQTMQSGLDSNQPFVKIASNFRSPGAKNIAFGSLPFGTRRQLVQFARGIGGKNADVGSVIRSISETTRKGIEGSLLNIRFTPPGLDKSMTLTIPREIGTSGIVAAGQDLSLQNVVGRRFIQVNKSGQVISSFNYEQWALLRARESLLPSIQGLSNRSSIQKEIRKFSQNVISPAALAETNDLVRARYDYIPRRFGSVGPDPFAEIRGLAGHISTFTDEQGRLLNETQEGQALLMKMAREGTITASGHKVFTTGRAGKGVFLDSNAPSPVAAAGAFPASRKPYQRLRGYSASASARSMMGPGSLTNRFSFLHGRGLAADPLRAPAGIQFFTSARHAGLEEGMIYADRGIRNMYNTMTMTHIPLSMEDVDSMNPIIKDILKSNSAIGGGFLGNDTLIKKGTYLGMGPGGLAVAAPHDMRIADALMSGSNLQLTAVHELEAEDMAKFFGSEKGLAQFVSKQRISQMTGQLPEMAADYVTAMSNLKKNRQLHFVQMFSALTELNHQNMRAFSENRLAKSASSRRAMMSLERHAGALFRGMESKIGTDAGFKETIRNLVGRARKVGLSDRQFGLVFGSLPEVFGADSAGALAEFNVPGSLASSVLKKQAIGVGHLFYGGPEELIGAGISQATIEPRLFTAMGMGQFGSDTSAMVGDIASRSIYSNPEASLSARELTRSLGSLSPDARTIGPGAGDRVETLAGLSGFAQDPQNPKFLMKSGGYVDFEGFGGVGKMYVPSGEYMKELAAFKTPAGKMIQGDLSQEYMGFLGRAQELQRTGDKAGFAALHEGFVNTVGRARAASILGKGGAASGSLMGSRFLKGAIPVSGYQSDDIFKVRISQDYFNKMQTEMRELADQMFTRGSAPWKGYLDSLELQAKEFMNKKGPGAGGYLLRHPIIGQYSFMPVRFTRDDSITGRPVINMPVNELDMMVAGKRKSLNYSLMVGMQGDVDADIYGAILADPRIAGNVAGMSMPGSKLAGEYESFAVRAALMKARSLEAGAVDEVAETVKSVIPSRIGQISFQMSRAKAALYQMGRNDDTLNSMFLLEWLEQNPIAGKHLTPEAARNLNDIINDVVKKVDIGHTKDLHGTIESMVRPGVLDEISSDTTIRVARAGTDQFRDVKVPGLNLGRALETIDTALEKFGVYNDKLSGLRASAMASGKGRFSVDDIFSAIGAGEGTALEGFFPTLAEASSNKVTRQAVQAAGQLSDYFIKNAKPIGVALGAGLLVSSMLAVPSRSITPPMPDVRVKAEMGDSMRQETMQPDSSVVGRPTAPAMPRGPGPVTLNKGTSAHVRVHGRVRGSPDASGMSKGIRSTLGPGTNVNTRISDDTRSLTAQNLQDIMDRP